MTLDLERIRRYLPGLAIEHHAALSSTNDRARALAVSDASSRRALVLADEQTAGRGRGANRWWTGRGSLALSLLDDPGARGIAREHAALVSLAAGVAVVEAVAPLLESLPLGLHWPNDVYVDRRKLAGVLVETLPDGRAVIGIGCNVNNSLAAAPAELVDTVATLVDLCGAEHDRTALVIAIVARLDAILDELAREPSVVARRADELCLQHGRQLCVEVLGRRITGHCAGIADDGALLLDTPGGRQRCYSGVLVKTPE